MFILIIIIIFIHLLFRSVRSGKEDPQRGHVPYDVLALTEVERSTTVSLSHNVAEIDAMVETTDARGKRKPD